MLFCLRIHSEVTNWLSRDYTQRNELDINSFSLSLIPLFSATMNSIKHVNFAYDIHRCVLRTIYNTTQNARKLHYNNHIILVLQDQTVKLPTEVEEEENSDSAGPSGMRE